MQETFYTVPCPNKVIIAYRMLSSRFAIRITYPAVLLCGLLFSPTVFSQLPQLVNYQAVARNTTSGQELANTEVLVFITIWANGPQELEVYHEEHSTNTNQFGLFTLQIGGGESNDDFSSIEWGAANHYLQVDIDAGEGMQTVSTTQFLSVPYALYAASAGNVNDDDADPENELNSSLEFDSTNSTISITDPGGTYFQDLSSLINDDDADPLNELIDENSFNINEEQILTITENGVEHTVDLSNVFEDEDWLYNDDESAIYNNENKVGIGTESPVAKLEVKGNAAGTAHLLTVKNGLESEIFTVRNNNRTGVNISDPNSSFQVDGSYAGRINFISANSNGTLIVDEEEQYIVVNFTSASITYNVQLPLAVTCPGRVYHIKKLANTFPGTLVLQPSGSDLIDGFDSSITVTVGSSLGSGQSTVVSAGVNGWIVFSEE